MGSDENQEQCKLVSQKLGVYCAKSFIPLEASKAPSSRICMVLDPASGAAATVRCGPNDAQDSQPVEPASLTLTALNS